MSEEIEKAITLVELKADREQLVANANAMTGAINYINQKISALEAKDEPDKPPEDIGE